MKTFIEDPGSPHYDQRARNKILIPVLFIIVFLIVLALHDPDAAARLLKGFGN